PESSFLGLNLSDTLVRLGAGLPHRFRNEQRVAADVLNLLDHEPLDLTGGDRLRRTRLPAPFLRREANVVAVALRAIPGRVSWRHRAAAGDAVDQALEDRSELVPHHCAARAA